MPKLLLATTNRGKATEYRSLFKGLNFDLVTLDAEGINATVNEKYTTFAENARLKASFYAQLSHLTTLADDSGLEVEALGGEPGVLSSRYAGDDASDADKVNYLLSRLQGVPWEKRTASFKCVIAIATPEGNVELCDGECRGLITFEARGQNGFGYDPVFFLPEFGKTMAEIPLEIKNKISHRAKAARKAFAILKKLSVAPE